jgi:osmotically-inducible protein OsmY
VPKGTINLSAERGVLVLRGEVPSAELRDRLASEAERIDGVWSVHNLLRVEGEEVGAASRS